MNFIKDYTYTLIGAALFSGIMSMLGPDGNRGRVFRFIAGAVLLLCMAYPLKNIVTDFNNLDLDFIHEQSFDSSYAENYTAKIMENEIKSKVNACIKEITGEGAKDIEISVVYENDKYTVTDITVILPKTGKVKIPAVESVINHRFGVKPKVITEGDDEYNG